MERDTSCGQVSRRYIEAEIACSRQTECAVYSADTAVPNVFTHRQLAVRGGVAMRKSVKHSSFVNNFQTVNVVYNDVLS